MSERPTIRPAAPEDTPRLHDVLQRAFAEYAGRLDPPSGVHAETVASVEAKIREGGALLAEAGGQAVGCAFCAPRGDHLYVGRFGVLPAHRGSGAGALLLAAAEERARALGFGRVRLNVRLTLRGLRAYYGARGYVPVRELAHAGYEGPTYVEMEKVLPGA